MLNTLKIEGDLTKIISRAYSLKYTVSLMELLLTCGVIYRCGLISVGGNPISPLAKFDNDIAI